MIIILLSFQFVRETAQVFAPKEMFVYVVASVVVFVGIFVRQKYVTIKETKAREVPKGFNLDVSN